jgi:hypothetical protein
MLGKHGGDCDRQCESELATADAKVAQVQLGSLAAVFNNDADKPVRSFLNERFGCRTVLVVQNC